MKDFKPMLAATIEDVQEIRFPCLVAPKLDGLRCIIRNGMAHSRNDKPFRNNYVQQVLAGLPDGLDGELIVGEPTGGHVLNRTYSGIMSSDGKPDFTFWVFDNYLDPYPFHHRVLTASQVQRSIVRPVPHIHVDSLTSLLEWERRYLDSGYEGLMTRHIEGPYKFGRSTMNEQYLCKLKRFRDGEAVVVGFEEGETNNNPLTRDELGRAKRSNHQENKVGANCIGTIIGQDCKTGQTLRISPGRMTHDQRRYYFDHPHELVGEIVKFKTFDYGSLDAPRFSTFQAFRSREDMAT